MSRYACRRCDWRPEGDEPRDQLAAHAIDAAHPLCVVCGLSLHPDDPKLACETCLTDARANLAEIVELTATLPEVMADAAYGMPSAPRNGARSDEQALPGGDGLVMLAGGSAGLTGLRAMLAGQEPPEDARDSDPVSVAYELSRWEDDWRLTRGEPAAESAATVVGAAGYLEVHTRWAANEHLAFDEFAGDLRKLLVRLRSVTGRIDRPETGAPCFDCGTVLCRDWTDAGLSEHWRCPCCRRVYEDAEYWLAVRAAMEAS